MVTSGEIAASAPRRVLMTADAVGGVWGYALDLARGLARAGIEVVLATMGPPPAPEQRAEAAAVPGLVLETGAFKLEWMDNPWADVDAAGRWLRELEVRTAPDLVHLNGYAHGVLPFQAPKLVVGHSCVFSWWHAVRGGSPTADWMAYQRRVAAGIQAGDMLVAPSRWMLGTLARHYGDDLLPPSRTIYNGRDPRDFPVGEKQAFVFAAGRLWDEAKNIAMLARVAGQLPWPVLLAGDTTLPSGTAGAHPAMPGENVRLLGPLPRARMANLYGRAAVYALPARYEPFGLSALEAGLAGCALVLGDLPSLREIWEGAALFVNPDDDDALAEALGALIRNGGARAAWAARARRRALRFSARRMCSEYLAVYAALREARAVRPGPGDQPGFC
jgi:glycosyltransferase involved in cell wall biosynthesis